MQYGIGVIVAVERPLAPRASRNYQLRLRLNDASPPHFLRIFSITFQQGVLGKENAEERVGGKGKAQEITKGEETLNEREKEGAGDERKQS